MKLLIIISVAFLNMWGVLSSQAFPFEEGQEFRRVKANSPISLKWSSTGEQPQFKVHLHATGTEIGCVIPTLSPLQKAVALSVQVQEHFVETLKTLSGIFNKAKDRLPTDIDSLLLSINRTHVRKINAAKQADYEEQITTNPTQAILTRVIGYTKPMSIQNERVAKMIENIVPGGSLPGLPQPYFQKGQRFQSRTHNKVYLVWDPAVDTVALMKIHLLDSGFKIFNASNDHEIGFITAAINESKPTHLIIGYFWIQESMRSKGFGYQALSSLMSVYRSKKAHLSYAKFFALGTTNMDPLSSINRVAVKAGFQRNDVIAGNIPMREFKTDFDVKK